MGECQPSGVTGIMRERAPTLGNNRLRSKSGSRGALTNVNRRVLPIEGGSSGLPHMVLQAVPLLRVKPSLALQAKLDAHTGVRLPREVSFLPFTHRGLLAAEALALSLGPVGISGHWAELCKNRTNAGHTHLCIPRALLNKGTIVFLISITVLLCGMGSARAE